MTLDEARIAVVRGEDAAIYAYTIAGARVTAWRRAETALDAHRTARAVAAATLSSAPEPSAAYILAIRPDSPDQARALLAAVENALVPVYADLAVTANGDERRQAVMAAQACATRAVAWGAPSQAFPS